MALTVEPAGAPIGLARQRDKRSQIVDYLVAIHECA